MIINVHILSCVSVVGAKVIFIIVSLYFLYFVLTDLLYVYVVLRACHIWTAIPHRLKSTQKNLSTRYGITERHALKYQICYYGVHTSSTQCVQHYVPQCPCSFHDDLMAHKKCCSALTARIDMFRAPTAFKIFFALLYLVMYNTFSRANLFKMFEAFLEYLVVFRSV